MNRAGDPTVGVVLMAYGTPRRREDVLAYYTDIRRGRPPSEEQLADLLRRYDAIAPDDGDALSPLAERTEAQRAALQQALDELAPGRFVSALGLKHSAPSIETAARDLVDRGARRLVGLVLAPHYSAFSVGQYLDRLRTAAETLNVSVTGIESWATEPAFIDFLARTVCNRLGTLPADTKVLFTADSLPQRILDVGDPYPDELRATASAVAERTGLGEWTRWATAWQSAGRTPEPWLGPDVLQVIDDLASSENHAGRERGILVCACGFVADHLEVLYDLDIDAARRAEAHGLAFARTDCVNDDDAVMRALARRVVDAA